MSIRPYYERDGITIYHGEALDVIPTLSGVGAVVTDPPYSSGGAMRGDRMAATTSKYVQSGTVEFRPEFSGDNRDQRGYLAWCSLWMCAAFHASVVGAPIACFSDWRQLPTTTDAVQSGGWVWRGIATWAKGYGRVMSSGFSSACEYLVWGTKGPAPEREDYPPGYVECQPPKNRVHIAQKPVEVMSWALRIAAPGAKILDPFMGSGTTLVAAALAGHPAIGVDCQESNCEIAAKRLAQGVLPLAEAKA